MFTAGLSYLRKVARGRRSVPTRHFAEQATFCDTWQDIFGSSSHWDFNFHNFFPNGPITWTTKVALELSVALIRNVTDGEPDDGNAATDADADDAVGSARVIGRANGDLPGQSPIRAGRVSGPT